MAEFIFKYLLEERGLADGITVCSSATSDEEIYRGVGNPIYPRASATLKRHGIPHTERRAVKLVREDYGKYDLFIGMDSANIRNMNLIFGADPDLKIKKLKEYSACGGDVSDPWYSGDFETAYSDISEGCKALLNAIT